VLRSVEDRVNQVGGVIAEEEATFEAGGFEACKADWSVRLPEIRRARRPAER